MVSVVSIVMGSSDGWRCSRIGDPSGGIGPRSSRSRQSIYAISRRVRFESMSATPTELVPRPPRGRVFEGARRVRLGDVSPAGRLRLDAATRYLQDLSADDTADSALPDAEAWVVRRTVLEVRSFPRYLEPLALATWCSGTGSHWAERRVSMVGEGGGRVDGATIWVHMDLTSGRPSRIPAGFEEIYGEARGGRTVKARFPPFLRADGPRHSVSRDGHPRGGGPGENGGRGRWPRRRRHHLGPHGPDQRAPQPHRRGVRGDLRRSPRRAHREGPPPAPRPSGRCRGAAVAAALHRLRRAGAREQRGLLGSGRGAAGRSPRPPRAASRRGGAPRCGGARSEEHTSELQSLMRISYAVFCLKKKKQ